MAKAVAHAPQWVEKTVTKVELHKVHSGVTLELTHDEARTLAEILGSVGGDPRNTARKHASEVADALSGVWYGFTLRESRPDFFISGSIMFRGELPKERE